MKLEKQYAILPNFCTAEQCKKVIAALNTLPADAENPNYKSVTNPQDSTIEAFVKDVATRFIALGYEGTQYFVDVLFNCMETGQSIPLHADYQGQGKQTINAIVYLSDPADYEGGFIEFPDIEFSQRPAQGTLVIYDATLEHQVTEITSGLRFTAPFAFTDDATVKANPYNFTGE